MRWAISGSGGRHEGFHGRLVPAIVAVATAAAALVAGGCGMGNDSPASTRSRSAADGKVLARVDAARITEGDLLRWKSWLGSRVDVSLPTLLRVLVRTSWLTAEADRLGIKPEVASVRRRVAELTSYEDVGARYSPVSRDTLLKQLLVEPATARVGREHLMAATLLAAQVEQTRLDRARRSVPQRRVAQYYAAHRRRYHVADARRIELMGGSRDRMLKARREIEAGKSFVDLALENELAEAPKGLWYLIRGHDEPQVERPVFSAKPHVLIGPLEYSSYYLFEVLEIIHPHYRRLAEEEGAIRGSLAPPVSQLNRSAERFWRSRTVCSTGYELPECGTRR
jgi:hypothetical protein